jgi:2-dehydro-3-deoxyphosphooctonate aldolase (KDO 8-P synthase)
MIDSVVRIPRPGQPPIKIGYGCPPLLMAGPCVLESEEVAFTVARIMRDLCRRHNISYIFKGSFDKANRTSINSFRGPGLSEGLELLAAVKHELGVPVVSDIHEPHQAETAAEVLDIVQIPAFLCRQTDLLVAAARTGKPINLKKGQFVAPWDMRYSVEKIRASGTSPVMLLERGANFGYNNLVVDMRSLAIMAALGCPVIYDATHSVQLPGGGAVSGGQRHFIAPLTRAAIGAGVHGLFMEVHPEPAQAKCDGANSYMLDKMDGFLAQIVPLWRSVAALDIDISSEIHE